MRSSTHESSLDESHSADVTPKDDGDEALIGGIDTAQLRNAVQRRLFGATIDPVRIGRFPILRRIGHGGMGVIYAAYDNELDRRIALKLLRPDARHGDEDGLRDRLLREAKALARLSHPAVVQVYEAGEHDGNVYLAMEFIEGVTLRRWLETAKRSPRDVLALYLQAARGLAAAHAAGLVHRDFKPDNAIVGEDGRVRVLDFGLALAAFAAPPAEIDTSDGAADGGIWTRMTQTGSIVGTPAYMAPEQFAGGVMDPRTDQFAFGVALFEALHGAHPFSTDSLVALSSSVLAGRVTWTRARGVNSRVQRVLRRALAVDPEDRFATMADLVVALERASRNTGRNVAVGLAVAAGSMVVVYSLGSSVVQDSLDEERLRAAALAEERDAERTRADVAERDLVARADALTLAEARFVAQTDPTRAVALLANLPTDDPAWSGEAWSIASRAADEGIARHVAAVPTGWLAAEFIDDDILLDDAGGSVARWTPGTDRIDVLATGSREAIVAGPHARHVAHCSAEGLTIVDTRSLERRVVAAKNCDYPRFSANGDWLAVSTGARLFVTSTSDGRTIERAEEGSPRWISDDGRSLLLMDESVWRLDLDAGTRRRVLAMTEAYSIVPAPDGASIVMHSAGSAGVFDVASGRQHAIDDPRMPQSSAFDPTGSHVALGFKGGDVHLVDLRAPRRQTPLPSPEPRPAAEMWTLSWSEDGRWLCGLLDDEVLVWDAVLRRGIARLRGLSAPSACRVRADGSVMAFNTQEVRTWPPSSTRVLDRGVVGVAARGDTWVTTHTDGRVVSHRGDQSSVLGTRTRVSKGEYGGVKVMPGARLAVTWSGRRLDAWPLDGGQPWLVTSLRHAMMFDFDDTGRWLAWIDNRTRITIVEITTGVKHHIDATDGAVWTDVAFDRRGRLVTASVDRHAVAPSQMHRFHGDGFSQRTDLEAPLQYPYAIYPLPGSDEIALLDMDGALALFDPESLTSRRIADRGPFGSMLVASLDRTLLASTSWKGQLRLWNLATGAEHRPRLDPGLAAGVGEVDAPATIAVEAAAFLDDGRLLSVDANGVLRSYVAPCPTDADALRAWVLAATDLRAAPGDIAARQRVDVR